MLFFGAIKNIKEHINNIVNIAYFKPTDIFLLRDIFIPDRLRILLSQIFYDYYFKYMGSSIRCFLNFLRSYYIGETF